MVILTKIIPTQPMEPIASNQRTSKKEQKKRQLPMEPTGSNQRTSKKGHKKRQLPIKLRVLPGADDVSTTTRRLHAALFLRFYR